MRTFLWCLRTGFRLFRFHLFFLFLYGWFGFAILFGFGRRLLRERKDTATWAITTMKSVSLMPNFSIVSSLAAVFPLKTILSVSAASPFASWIFVFSVWIYVRLGLRYRWVRRQLGKLSPWGFWQKASFKKYLKKSLFFYKIRFQESGSTLSHLLGIYCIEKKIKENSLVG
jgi:hypothetical protein